MSRLDTDIIERLRWDKRYTKGHVPVTLEDAAVEIERLRGALEKAAELADERENQDSIDNGVAASGAAVGLGDAIRALGWPRHAAGTADENDVPRAEE